MASLMSSNKGGNRFRLYFNVFFAAIVAFAAFRYEKKMRSAPLPDKPSSRGLFGLPEGTGAAPMTGAPAAHCLCIHREQSLGHWQSGMVNLSEDKSTNTAALNVNCAA